MAMALGMCHMYVQDNPCWPSMHTAAMAAGSRIALGDALISISLWTLAPQETSGNGCRLVGSWLRLQLELCAVVQVFKELTPSPIAAASLGQVCCCTRLLLLGSMYGQSSHLLAALT